MQTHPAKQRQSFPAKTVSFLIPLLPAFFVSFTGWQPPGPDIFGRVNVIFPARNRCLASRIRIVSFRSESAFPVLIFALLVVWDQFCAKFRS
jgi:hypothetical protein